MLQNWSPGLSIKLANYALSPDDDDLGQLTTEHRRIIGIGFFLIRTNISVNMIYAL